MDLLRSLQTQLIDLVEAQPDALKDLAQFIYTIPRIIDSQVYGFVLRRPAIFVAYLRTQLQFCGEITAPATECEHFDESVSAQIAELRKLLYIHIHRVDRQLFQDPKYKRLVACSIHDNEFPDIPLQFVVNLCRLMGQSEELIEHLKVSDGSSVSDADLDDSSVINASSDDLASKPQLRVSLDSTRYLMHTFLTGHTINLLELSGARSFRQNLREHSWCIIRMICNPHAVSRHRMEGFVDMLQQFRRQAPNSVAHPSAAFETRVAVYTAQARGLPGFRLRAPHICDMVRTFIKISSFATPDDPFRDQLLIEAARIMRAVILPRLEDYSDKLATFMAIRDAGETGEVLEWEPAEEEALVSEIVERVFDDHRSLWRRMFSSFHWLKMFNGFRWLLQMEESDDALAYNTQLFTQWLIARAILHDDMALLADPFETK